MTTAAGMQVISSEHHLHHAHHAHMLGVVGSALNQSHPFSPAFSFASSSSSSSCAAASKAEAAWPLQQQLLNSSSSSSSSAAATSSSNASSVTAFSARESNSFINNNSNSHRSPSSASAASSPCSNLTRPPTPPHPLAAAARTTTATLDNHNCAAADASSPPLATTPSSSSPCATPPPPHVAAAPASNSLLDAAATAVGSPSRSHSPSPSPCASPPPPAASSSPDRLHGSPNRSVNARSSPNHSPSPAPPLPPPPAAAAFSSFFKPLSSYQSAAVGMEVDVDEFLKEEQSSDMEQFLLELLQQPGPAVPSPHSLAPNSPPPPPLPAATSSSSSSSFARSSSMPGMRQQTLARQHHHQQQQAVGLSSSSYQTLMEMALDSNSSFMDAAGAALPSMMHMGMDLSAVSYTDVFAARMAAESEAANCKPSSSSSSLTGGVKPSFVVSHNNHHGHHHTCDASTTITSSSSSMRANSVYGGGGGGYMESSTTDSKDGVVYTPAHRTTFLEAMSTKPEQWMNLSSNKASEVDELEKEFMRIYGPNVSLRMQQQQQQQQSQQQQQQGDVVRVKSEPTLLRTSSMSSLSMAHDTSSAAAATSMAMAMEMAMGPLGIMEDEAAGAGLGVKMEAVGSFADQFDAAGEVSHADTVMLEQLDSANSVDMNQLMADAFISCSSGMSQHQHQGGLDHLLLQQKQQQQQQQQQAVMMPNGGTSYAHFSEMDPTMMQQQQHQQQGYFSSPAHPQQQQQHKSSNQLVVDGLSSSWPGGGGAYGNGSANYKHYGQPLVQLKNKKMSVNFMAGGQQAASNSSTLALVQALAPASNGAAGGSHYHARRFLNSQSLPNLQLGGSNNHSGGNGNGMMGQAGTGDFHSAAGQLSRSNSLPSQRGLMHHQQQQQSGSPPLGGSPLGGSPLGGSPLGGSPYLGHSVSFSAPADHAGSSRGSSYLGPQHRIGSSPSLQSLAGGGGGGGGGGTNSSYSHSLHHSLLNGHHHSLSNSSSGLASLQQQGHFNNSSSLAQLQASDFHQHFQQQQQQQQRYYRNSAASSNGNAGNGGADDLASIISAAAGGAGAAAGKDGVASSSSSPVMMATGLQLVHLLIACAEAVAEDSMELAHVILERLSTLVVPLGNPMQRLAAYFAEALAARISRKNRGPLYRGLHGDTTVSKIEKIEAMSVLYACVPTGKFGHLTANQVLLDAIQNEQNVHLVDLHIWYGMQWPAFMQALASREGGPPNLRISAVGSSYEELKETGETLLECAKQLNVPLEYCPIVVALEEFNVRLLEVRRGEVCVVNSFNQLHCVLHKGTDNFNRILRGLRSLNPKVFALTENDGNHNSPVFLTRFMECLHYYSAVFDAFEASMPAESTGTARMKTEQLFAAQKIRNIIACEGPDRVERHETMVEWGKRMEMAGFTSVPLSGRAVSQAQLLLNLYYPDGYTLANNNGYLALGWHTMPLIGVSAWR